MKILIVDEKIAKSPRGKSLFERDDKQRKIAAVRGPAAGHLIVSCASPKAKRSKLGKLDCSCGALDLGDQPDRAATILDELGVSLLNRGCGDEGAELIELAYKIRLKFFGPDHPFTAQSQNNRARIQRERGNYALAETTIEDALRINRRVYGDRGLPVATSLVEGGLIQLAQGRPEKAAPTASLGLDILAAAGLTQTDFLTTRLMDVRGRAELELGKLAAADATFTELLAIDRKQVGAQHPKYLTHQANYAGVKVAQGKLVEAEKSYRLAIDGYVIGMGRPCHPNLIDLYARLGSVLRKSSPGSAKFEEAHELLTKALALNQFVRGAAHTLVANDHANLGRWHYSAGDRKNALAEFGQAAGVYRKNIAGQRMAADHPFIPEVLTWQGRTLVESENAGAAAKAESLLDEAIKLWPIHLGDDNPGQGIASACLGHALTLQRKDPARALQLLQYAYPIVLGALGPKNAFAKLTEAWLSQAGGTKTQQTTAS